MTTGRINQVTTVAGDEPAWLAPRRPPVRWRTGGPRSLSLSRDPTLKRTLLANPPAMPGRCGIRGGAPRCRRPAVSTTRRRPENRKKYTDSVAGNGATSLKASKSPVAGGQAHLCGAPAQARTPGRRLCGPTTAGRAGRTHGEPGGTPTQTTAQTCQNRSRQIRNLCCDACPS